MEIERKWMVSGWPPPGRDPLPLLWTEYQEQGYVHATAPIVRIRLEARIDGGDSISGDRKAPRHSGSGSATQAAKESVSDENARYIMCFKSAGYLSREEIEIEICREEFDRLARLIGRPLIHKIRRVYQLPEDLKLEVNLVDEEYETAFMYAEVEFDSEKQARSFHPADCGLGDYLLDDVTEKPGQSMSAYWTKTRPGASARGDLN